MKVPGLLLWMLVFCTAQISAQNPAPPKDWTPWTAVQGEWAEFYVFTNFRGGNKTPEQLARKDIKSLRVDCLIMGRLLGELPPDLKGVKTFKVLYTEYGKFKTMDDLGEDTVSLPYSSKGQYVRQVVITRPASAFDVEEAGQPLTVVDMTTTFPTALSALGVDPVKTKVAGHKHRVDCEWRRKGNTVELRIKDYRPTPEKGQHQNP